MRPPAGPLLAAGLAQAIHHHAAWEAAQHHLRELGASEDEVAEARHAALVAAESDPRNTPLDHLRRAVLRRAER